MIKKILDSTTINKIKTHLRDSQKFEKFSWKRANLYEDSLVSDFLSKISTDNNPIITDTFEVNFTYQKISVQHEKNIGADGIITLEIYSKNGDVFTKSLLFQAKKSENNDKNLFNQIENMNRIASEGSIVFLLDQSGFYAIKTEQFLNYQTMKTDNNRFGEYLSTTFLECKIGTIGMKYDYNQKTIVIDEEEQNIAAKHLLSILIQEK